MDELDRKQFSELITVVKENNRLLHKMRRHAVWGGVLKALLYVVVLVVAPLWLYSTYLAPVVKEAMKTYQEIQGTGAKVQAQFGDMQNFFKQFKESVSPQ